MRERLAVQKAAGGELLALLLFSIDAAAIVAAVAFQRRR